MWKVIRQGRSWNLLTIIHTFYRIDTIKHEKTEVPQEIANAEKILCYEVYADPIRCSPETCLGKSKVER